MHTLIASYIHGLLTIQLEEIENQKHFAGLRMCQKDKLTQVSRKSTISEAL